MKGKKKSKLPPRFERHNHHWQHVFIYRPFDSLQPPKKVQSVMVGCVYGWGGSLQQLWTQPLNHSGFCKEPPKTCCHVSKIHSVYWQLRGRCAELWSVFFCCCCRFCFFGVFFRAGVPWVDTRSADHMHTPQKHQWSSHGSNMIMVKCPPLCFSILHTVESEQQIVKAKKKKN